MRLTLLLLPFLWFFPARSHTQIKTPDGLPLEAMALLNACQDATYRLQFDLAEAFAQKAMALSPLHPLPRIFLQMAILARIQESKDAKEEDPELTERFERESQAALLLAQNYELKAPNGRSQLYLGSSLGASGLVKMLGGSYLKAYRDGQAAAGSLRMAVERDPLLYDAYLGLGQYDYYCGRLGGFLRFVARLKGDIQGGIAMLETCALKGDYAGTAARINLARIYSLEEIDYAKALPYVREMRRRYPGNYSYVQYALATAKGRGPKESDAQGLLEAVFQQSDDGWRPPDHVDLKLEPIRLDLARAYHGQGRSKKAMGHFKRLAKSKYEVYSKAGILGMEGAH